MSDLPMIILEIRLSSGLGYSLLSVTGLVLASVRAVKTKVHYCMTMINRLTFLLAQEIVSYCLLGKASFPILCFFK